MAGFSDYGPKHVHIGAPGTQVLSTWRLAEYRRASGTSMACPHVAGALTLMWNTLGPPNMAVSARVRAFLTKYSVVAPELDQLVEGGHFLQLNAGGAAGASAGMSAAGDR
jgi:subtilisin